MKFSQTIATALALTAFQPAMAAKIDWSQPPVACVEDIVPNIPNRPCPDLSGMENPGKDFPPTLSEKELAYWTANKRPMSYCRSQEILKREAAAPGTFGAGKVQVAWMQNLAVQNAKDKIAAVYEASRANQLPAQVLAGALYQESLFSELGIADDGGNYSCGVGQINVEEWCRWISKQPAKTKAELGWPTQEVSCSLIDKAMLKPFYDIAKGRLKGEPEYRLSLKHFGGIAPLDVVAEFPEANNETQKSRFQMIASFIVHCSKPRVGIAAKAHELASLYKRFVPEGLKQSEQYPAGKKFNRECKEASFDKSYPLNTGWLLAVGMYNAGPRASDLIAFYNGWTAEDVKKPETFVGFTPAEMIQSMYWGGVYNPVTDLIDLTSLSGKPTSFKWFKTCVLQRHIARVVQHVTLPGTSTIVDTLEGDNKCAQSTTDTETGKLKTSVPEFRQTSSGKKN